MAQPNDFALRADAVTRDFGAVRALDALSLDVPSVAVDGIVGPVTWRALVSGMLAG